MVAEICSRFGGYPSDYIKNKKLGELYYDHKIFLALTKGEILSYPKGNKNGT